jgi:hypothetical protein
MRVLVCGGRDYNNAKSVFEGLDMLHSYRTISAIIHGAARGADRLAGEWARTRNILTTEFPADWDHHGRSAGPIRNQRMLDEGLPDLVAAFPGGAGTEDMITRARAAGIKVIQWTD